MRVRINSEGQERQERQERGSVEGDEQEGGLSEGENDQ